MTVSLVQLEKMFVDGQWVEAESRETIGTIDPSTGQEIARVPRGGAPDIDRAVAAARRAFPGWKRTNAFQRGQYLRKLSQLVAETADDIALLEAKDSGHYLRKAKELIEATCLWLDYHAGLADKIGGRTIDVPGNRLDFTLLEPLGVTGHIIPWNYPFLLIARSVAPALACGNTAVIKPAEQTPLTALEFARLCEMAGFPRGVVNVVTGFGPEAGAALASHEDVDGITFTGSVATGKLVMKMAAEHVAKVNLELGGKSPMIVYGDARMPDCVEAAVQGILSHAGQVCIATSRAFVHRSIYDRFVEALLARMKTVKVGLPDQPDVQMGPLISAEHMERVLKYIEIGKQQGAKLAVGGDRPSDPRLANGYYVNPTVFVGVENSMRIAQEEIFGPVLSVIPWGDESKMLEQVNDTSYGLAASIWTQDIGKALNLVRNVEAGVVFVNDWLGEFPQAPHGGYKQSGVNREEGLETIQSYTQVKNVVINLDEKLTETWFDAPL